MISDTEIIHLDKGHDRLATLGLSLGEAKALLNLLQERIVTAQAAAYVAGHRLCPICACRFQSKDRGRAVFRTAFGKVPLSSPRFDRCGCDPAQTRTFSSLTGLLTEHAAPVLLYLETKWASLVSFGMTIDLLKDVLPIASTASAATVRNHLHKVAEHCEAELGGERLLHRRLPARMDGAADTRSADNRRPRRRLRPQLRRSEEQFRSHRWKVRAGGSGSSLFQPRAGPQ